MNHTQAKEHTEDILQWYDWGREAFDRAAGEGKPMRIVIDRGETVRSRGGKGTVGRLTARYFVPVCVDGAAFPEVAEAYRMASAMLTGRNALPLEVLADSSGVPFFAAGAPGEAELAGLLSSVALHWMGDGAVYEETAALLRRQLDEEASPTATMTLREIGEGYLRTLLERCAENEPLQPQDLLFLFTYAKRTGERVLLDGAERALLQLCMGPRWDHIGGGFYAADALGYEKRLSDQSWMMEVLLSAVNITGRSVYKKLLGETADFVIRELRHECGGFCEGVVCKQGNFLTADRVAAVVGEEVALDFCAAYGVGAAPSLPYWVGGSAVGGKALHELRMKLYRDRLQRGGASMQEKILLGQNGLMIAALAKAGRTLGVHRYLTAAVGAEEFLRSRMVAPPDLRRYYCRGKVAGEGALEDYGGYAMGLYELYRCGCGEEYLCHSGRVMARGDALFSDHDRSGYFLGRDGGNLPVRPKLYAGEGLPCGWSVALGVLVKLAREIRHPGLRRRVRQLVEHGTAMAEQQPCGYALSVMLEASQ